MGDNVGWVLAAAAVLALAGCKKAESPPPVREDLAESSAEGGREAPQAQYETDEQIASGPAGDNARETAAESSYKMAVAQAEAAHRIAIERCEALTGHQEEDCKERADNQLERARRDAEQRRDRGG